MADEAFIAEMFPSMVKGASSSAPSSAAPAADPHIAEMFPSMVKAATPGAATGQAPVAGATQTAAADQAKGAAAAEQKQDAATTTPLELEAPEGFNADDPTFAEFKAIAGKHGLDQAKATELLQLHQRAVAEQQKTWDAQIGRWNEAVKNDAEIGGPHLKQTFDRARAAADRYGSPEFRDLLENPQYGSNPEIIRLLARVGEELHGKGRR